MIELPRDPQAIERDFLLAELSRRLDNVVRLGTVREVDADGVRVRVAYHAGEDGEEALTGWRPWFAARAGESRTWDPPTEGEQAVLLSPGGDLAQGFALAAVNTAANPPPTRDPDVLQRTEPDGAVFRYDRAAHRLEFGLPDGAEMRIRANVAIDGRLGVTQDIHADGSIDADGDIVDSRSTMQAMRDTYNRHNHASNGAAPPTQRMT